MLFRSSLSKHLTHTRRWAVSVQILWLGCYVYGRTLSVRVCACVCLSVCLCVCACARVSASVSVRLCVHACVCVRVCLCLCDIWGHKFVWWHGYDIGITRRRWFMRIFPHVPIFQKTYKSYRISFFEKVKMQKVSCKG